MTPGAVPVLVNAAGGTAASAGDRLREQVEAAFAEARLSIAYEEVAGCDMQARVAALTEHPLIVVGGGDGTLGCAAAVLAGGDTALGVLALGTRNHLAGELGVPLDLPGAAKLIAAGCSRRIDIVRVNGRTFVNNASIGLYPTLVEERDAAREQHDVPKWLAAIPAAWAALRRLRHHRLRLTVDGGAKDVVTPLLFVGNNRYSLAAGQVGQREALDDGVMSVFAVASQHRAALIVFAARALLGHADRRQDFAAIGETRELTVTGRSREVDVALDGEVVTLGMPLHFTSEPGALRVIAP